MPSDSETSRGNAAEQRKQDRRMDFYPDWEKRSRDDIPSTNNPLPKNSVVDKIIAVNGLAQSSVGNSTKADQKEAPSS